MGTKIKKTKHMRNCNWRTKLKKKQNFYKRNKDKKKMRTEIEKQQIKKIIVHFSGQEREKKERKKKNWLLVTI